MSKQDNFPLVVENDDGLRPAGSPSQCFYCKSVIGEPHKHDCVVVTKKVKLKYSFDVVVEAPHHWDEGMILFHRNEGSWCADNAIAEIEQYAEKVGCLCGVFNCLFVDVVDETPRRKINEQSQ